MTGNQATPTAAAPAAFRREHDLLGELEVPADAYWGVHTARAVANFQISGVTIASYPRLIEALACVKQAAALANLELGLIAEDTAAAIVSACVEIRGGRLHDAFVVDVIQGGAGTSTNMNANEVIANRALELLGCRRGEYSQVHPNEHVNLGQSTNDVYPTADKVALVNSLQDLLVQMEVLRLAFDSKAAELRSVLKVGRTQLQDAVPMTLGQEFGSFAVMVEEDQARIRESLRHLLEINLGATAIGTGINAHPEYASRVRHHLEEVTGLPVTTAANLIEATQDCGVFVLVSALLKRYAVKLSKMCNDLRLLSSGPRAGFNEINLPPHQAGSSIMPGKVNPVIPEVVNQIAFEVIGNDLTVTMAAEAGQLQLNAFEPMIAYSLFNSIRHLTAASSSLAHLCVADISANASVTRAQAERSIGIVTALNPLLGYEVATKVASAALESGRGVIETVVALGLLDEGRLRAALDPEVLAGLGPAR